MQPTILWKARNTKLEYQANGDISGPVTVEQSFPLELVEVTRCDLLRLLSFQTEADSSAVIIFLLLRDTPWAIQLHSGLQTTQKTYFFVFPVHLSVRLISCLLHYMLLGLRVPQWIKMI